MNLCFINESRGTLKSFILLITIKIIPKLEYKEKFETEIEKISRRGHVLQKTKAHLIMTMKS